MKPRHRSDVQHAYWLLEKRKIVRVSSPVLRGTGTQGLRRPRFPFFVLQCQRAVERAVETTLPNPQWNQKACWESTTAGDRPGSEKTRGIPRNCQWVARSRIVPQEVGATRADNYLGSDYLSVNAEKTDLLKKIAIKQRFATTASNWDPEATFLPE